MNIMEEIEREGLKADLPNIKIGDDVNVTLKVVEGETERTQVFARTACFNADVAAFYTKWLADLAGDQKPSGAVPHVIPNVLSLGKAEGASASAGWAG